MPPPPLFLGPAVGKLTLHVSRTVLIGLSDAALTLVLGRWAWQQLPLWIRQDVSLQSFVATKDSKNSKELSTLTSVLDKIQVAIDAASRRVHALRQEYDTPHGVVVPFLHASLAAYCQLLLQLQTLYPQQQQQPHTSSDNHHSPSPTRSTLHHWRECLAWSVAAYETDTDVLQQQLPSVVVLDHNALTERAPGHVGYYIAVDDIHRRLVVAVRGTASLEEVVTDCCGGAVAWNDDDDEWDRVEVVAAQPPRAVECSDGVEVEAPREERVWWDGTAATEEYAVRCHEGILVCAQRLVQRIRHTIEGYVVGRGYSLLLCGHSLGAGVATLTGMILRSQIPILVDEPDRLQVVAFAPPPVLDHDSAVAASAFTVSLVNQSDLIPRLSLVNLTVFVEFLRTISERLQEAGLAPQCPSSALAFFRKLTQPMSTVKEDDLLLSLEEFNLAFSEAEQRVRLRDPDHLFVAGRVYFMAEQLETDDTVDSRDDDSVSAGKICCLETNGASEHLRRLEVDLFRMIRDHVSTTYHDNIQSLLGSSEEA